LLRRWRSRVLEAPYHRRKGRRVEADGGAHELERNVDLVLELAEQPAAREDAAGGTAPGLGATRSASATSSESWRRWLESWPVDLRGW
jgi:hypothetical protein